VHRPVNQDDQHFFAHAMASDFSVAWQYITFVYSFILHMYVCTSKFSKPLTHFHKLGTYTYCGQIEVA
jgi:hypothetical protein